MSPAIGTRSLQGHIDNLGQKDRLTPALHDLQQIVSLEHETYDKFTSEGKSDLVGDALCRHVESAVGSEDILNLQFTSGTYTILRYLKRNSKCLCSQQERLALPKLPCCRTCKLSRDASCHPTHF